MNWDKKNTLILIGASNWTNEGEILYVYRLKRRYSVNKINYLQSTFKNYALPLPCPLWVLTVHVHDSSYVHVIIQDQAQLTP